ncbi:MAG TPA: hypothetical protein DD671_02330 [Balneolaceae bacterium]|nr:hypothetical protein [Balneolaceae bacterium]
MIMRYFTYKLFLGLILFGLGCSSSENVVSESSVTQETERVDEPEVSKLISLNINEAVYFEFEKSDSTWDGTLTTHALNEEGEKVVDREFVAAQDSSWNDFNAFVEFLKIMNLPPQNKIEGWVPDSSTLPRRVYSFKVFDGDTTRSFSYQDPINGIRDYWQAQNVLTFVTFIQNDLRWVEKESIE